MATNNSRTGRKRTDSDAPKKPSGPLPRSNGAPGSGTKAGRQEPADDTPQHPLDGVIGKFKGNPYWEEVEEDLRCARQEANT